MTHTLRTRGRALAVAVVLVAGATGCSVTSPFQTAQTQSLADGVAVKGFDGATVDNLALVSGEEGGDAVVTGAVQNSGAEELTFTIAAGGSNVSTTIAPNTLVTLDEEDLTLEGVEDPPGVFTDVEVTVGETTVPRGIPIVLPTGYYEEFAPEGYTPPPPPSEPESEED